MGFKFLLCCVMSVATIIPSGSSAAVAQISPSLDGKINQLKGKRTHTQLELRQALHIYFPTAPQVVRIRQRIIKLSQQLVQLEHQRQMQPKSYIPPHINFRRYIMWL